MRLHDTDNTNTNGTNNMYNTNNSKMLGYFQLSLAQFCIAVNIILGKSLGVVFPIYSLLTLRFLVGLLFILFLTPFQKETRILSDLKSLTPHSSLIIFLQALCGGFLFNVFVLWGLQHTTATAVGIINAAVPALVALFSFLLLREKLKTQTAIAIGLSVLGIAILGFGKSDTPITSSLGSSGESDLWGIFLVILAIIPEALFTVFAKLLKKPIHPWTTTFLVNLINFLLFVPFALGDSWAAFQSLTGVQISQIILYGLTGGLLFFIFWYRGLANTTANTAALFMGVMPIGTSILACWLLKESLSVWDTVGMMFVITAVWVGTQSFGGMKKAKENLNLQ